MSLLPRSRAGWGGSASWAFAGRERRPRSNFGPAFQFRAFVLLSRNAGRPNLGRSHLEMHGAPRSHLECMVPRDGRFAIGCTLMIVQQFSGINAVIFYAGDIMSTTGMDDPNVGGLIIMGIQVGRAISSLPGYAGRLVDTTITTFITTTFSSVAITHTCIPSLSPSSTITHCCYRRRRRRRRGRATTISPHHHHSPSPSPSPSILSHHHHASRL